MSNEFSNNKKVKLIGTQVAEAAPFLKAKKSYMTQGELEGKKYGRTYNIYIPDTGKVVDGIVANPDEITEREVTVTLDNKNTSVEIDAWEKLTGIESFNDEIAKPRGVKLGQSLDKKAVEKVTLGAQLAVVGAANFATLSEGASELDMVGAAGKFVSFSSPKVMSKIAAAGLSNFIPAQEAKEIYSENYLGQYAGAAQVQDKNMMVVKVPAQQSIPTITLVADASGKGFDPITSINGADAVNGLAFKASGLKVVGLDGTETDEDYIIVVDENGKIPELRITVEGENFSNPNAWVANGVNALTLVPILADGETYDVAVVRTEDALGYDTYKFSDLPGSENETVSVEGMSFKLSSYGDGKNLETLYRIDAPHVLSCPDGRKVVNMYLKR